jgi:hypothetical protein
LTPERPEREDDPALPERAGDDPWSTEVVGPGADNAYHPQKRFRAATDEELDPQSFIIADDRSALRAVLRGGRIAKDRGDADFIGGAIRRLARALREAAQNYKQVGEEFVNAALLRRVKFGQSVIVELEISEGERVERGLDGSRRAPTIEAARDLGALLSADADDLVKRALPLGPDAVAEYKRFLNLLGEDEVTLEWQVPDTRVIVVVTSEDARRDHAILDRQGERTTGTVTVPGTLTMADSRRHRFELSLFAGQTRPPLLRNKSLV